jgi:hypothetical protein
VREFLGKFFAKNKSVPLRMCEALSGTNKQESKSELLFAARECNPMSAKRVCQNEFAARLFLTPLVTRSFQVISRHCAPEQLLGNKLMVPAFPELGVRC